MRELALSEVKVVSGGNVFGSLASQADKYAEAALTGAVLATAPKIVISTAMTAVQGSVAGIGTAIAWNAGQATGNWLNNNTPIQDWIGKGVDKLTGLNKGGNGGGGNGGGGNGNSNTDRDRFGGRD